MKLEPCPFCGSDPMSDFSSTTDGPAYSFHCNSKDCPAWPNVQGETEAEAIAAWNARTPPARQSDEALADDDLLDEIEQAISDSIDLDWQPSWAARAILPILRAREAAAHAAGRAEGIEEAADHADRWNTGIGDAIRTLEPKP